MEDTVRTGNCFKRHYWAGFDVCFTNVTMLVKAMMDPKHGGAQVETT